ncbi:OLC1v1017063C2 [Oldenlandia corymbosa var. corymbosa]|uniref:OLC1v1017063C2 n=2 Tax=Oldenlandia corymbosa var. corymbosa TaxID=529605 RepID=A0AAV1E8J5_OLDCO|nr:OLC1v1017063C2 [Oldenlandia corymbosa var. corymbosa]
MTKGDTSDRDQRDKDDRKLSAGEFGNVFVIGVGGAIATAILLSRSKGSWKSASSGPFRTSFQEEARRRYNRRMQEEYEEEMERVERIRRMQSVFNRERNKHKRNYESWAQNGDGTYHQHFQRNDWYWKGDTSFRDRGTNFRDATKPTRNHLLSHHYSVLGLDRTRTKPYTDDEIKSAFRAKALEFHPDQNQNNKEVAEAKFREVMAAYEAIKVERKKK